MKIQNYKIVYCAPAIYSAGGVERVVTVKASYFAEVYNYDVTIIVTEGEGLGSFFQLSPKVKVINLNLGFEQLWHVSFVKKIFLYVCKQRRYKRLLTKELMRLQPDFTISVLRREINFINYVNDGSIKIGELHVNRSNYRNFTSKDSNVVKRLFSKYWMRSLVCQLRKLDRMVVLTADARKDWPELPNIILIPDPLPFKVQTLSRLSEKRIISIGRYVYEKGNDLLLRVWAKVSRYVGDWTLDVYGMGDRTPYYHLMKELDIDENRCRLHGSLSDVYKEYLASSIFVLPSRFEGFGLVIIEAMSCGLPVVSFDCENGPRNVITDGQNGFLVHPFDVDEFADRVIQLIMSEDLRGKMGNYAHQSSFRYEIDYIGLQWRLLFEECKQANEV